MVNDIHIAQLKTPPLNELKEALQRHEELRIDVPDDIPTRHEKSVINVSRDDVNYIEDQNKIQVIDNNNTLSSPPKSRILSNFNECESAITPSPRQENYFLSYYDLSEQEESIVREMEEMKRLREAGISMQSQTTNDSSLFSQTEIKPLIVVQPQINIRQFQKYQPSPILPHKSNTESPLLPAFAKLSERLNYSGTNLSSAQQSLAQTQHRSKIPNGVHSKESSLITTWVRYGSARGQELLNNVAQLRLPSASIPRNRTLPEEIRVTPTRKLVNKLETEQIDPKKISDEFEQINHRISEVENLKAYITEQMQKVQTRSDDEKRLFDEHIRLVEEQNQLSHRQDYLNTLLDLYETSEKCVNMQKQLQLNSLTDEDEPPITCDLEQKMEELKTLVNRKNELYNILMDFDAVDENTT